MIPEHPARCRMGLEAGAQCLYTATYQWRSKVVDGHDWEPICDVHVPQVNRDFCDVEPLGVFQ